MHPTRSRGTPGVVGLRAAPAAHHLHSIAGHMADLAEVGGARKYHLCDATPVWIWGLPAAYEVTSAFI